MANTFFNRDKSGKLFTYLWLFIRSHPWLTAFAIGILVLASGFYFSVLAGAFGPIPTEEELTVLNKPLASEVFAADGQRIGKYFLEDRSDITYKELAPDLVMALIATEDARFYQHSGVDIRSLFRVFFKSILLRDKSAGGGSTLSQQVAKNFFPRQNYHILSLPINKLKESIIARRLERVYTKEEIIALYLNTMSFGENSYGIKVAARRFFNTTPEDLSIDQAAVLVGLLKAPTAYNPRLHPERAIQRRDLVINQMAKYNYINASEAEEYKSQPLSLDYHYMSHNDGIAPYFREFLRLELSDWLKTHAKPDGSHYDLYKDGLKIYTSIDPRMQKHAEAAVKEEMKRIQKNFDRVHRGKKLSKEMQKVVDMAVKRSDRYRGLYKQGKSKEEIDQIFLQPVKMQLFTWDSVQDTIMSPMDSVIYYQYFLHSGLMAMEPQTGYVRAWVGGIDHNFFKYDHVTSTRQTGSIFKPIVFAAALEKGIQPCAYISNTKESLGDRTTWVPRNSDNYYGGEYSMQGALTYSVNIAAVNLMFETGMRNVINTAKNLGVSSELPPVASLALGTADVSLYDMLSVYGTFANRGKAAKPIFVLRVEDKNGQPIYAPPIDSNQVQVLKKETADIIIHILKNVVNRGTASGLRARYLLPNDIAGKTGTTQSQADGWFVGTTPSLVAGAWVGAEDRRVHFRSMRDGQGARTAMPIYANFMKRLNADEQYQHIKKEKFPRPSWKVLNKLDCDPYVFRQSMSDFKKWWEEQQAKEGNN